MAISFKGAHFPQEIILMGVRWYLAYPLSYRHVEELMEERGVPVDHATIQRVVYPRVADNIPAPPPYRLRGVHQPVLSPRNGFSRRLSAWLT